MLVYGIGLIISSPSTTTVCPGPSPGPTCSMFSWVCTWYTPASSALADNQYSMTELPGMSKTLPGGSLANISHLLPALVDSEKIDRPSSKVSLYKLTNVP